MPLATYSGDVAKKALDSGVETLEEYVAPSAMPNKSTGNRAQRNDSKRSQPTEESVDPDETRDLGPFRKNEIVWVKQGKFDWWPAYVLDPYMNMQKQGQHMIGFIKVCFGYDATRTFAKIPVKGLVAFTGADQWTELPDISGKPKKPKVNKDGSIKIEKKRAMPKKLLASVKRAAYDYNVWVNGTDKERHCLCRMLDDGAFMYGCTGCSTCWFHPECMDIKVSEAQKEDPSLIPKFKCPFVEGEPRCLECVAIDEKERAEARERKSKKDRLAKAAARAELKEKRKLQGKLNADLERLRKKRKDLLGQAVWVEVDPDATETEGDSDETEEEN